MYQKIKLSLEILVGAALVFGYAWLITPLYSQWVKICAAIPILLFFIFVHYGNKESLETIGFCRKNWHESFKPLLVFTITSLPVLYLIWRQFFPVNYYFYDDPVFWKRIFIYPVVVLCQVYVFLVFFFRWFKKLFFPKVKIAIVFSALVFSAIHIPTPPLMLLCFIAGVVWAGIYHKYPNVFTITIFHSISGIFCSFVLQMYSEVGPNADPGRWSKKEVDSVYGYIDGVNNLLPAKNKDDFEVVVDHRQNRIVVTGWVASEDRIKSIKLGLGGKSYPVHYGIERKDVAAHFNNPNFLHSGFSVDIPTSDFGLGYHRLFLKVDVEGRMFYRSPGVKTWVNLK